MAEQSQVAWPAVRAVSGMLITAVRVSPTVATAWAVTATGPRQRLNPGEAGAGTAGVGSGAAMVSSLAQAKPDSPAGVGKGLLHWP